LQKRNDFSQEEQHALSLATPREVTKYWTSKSQNSEKDLQRARQIGWKKWTSKYQTFGAGVAGFMNDWEPIVDLVRRGGGSYGELLVGTFSALFVVAEMKEESEGYLSTALSDIRDAMIGFALYENIFNGADDIESDLRDQMINAYCQFVNLTVDATKYYKGGGRSRWFSTFREPRKFKDQAEEVKALIARIRLRCDDLMSRDISDIKASNEELKYEVQRLHRKFDDERLYNLLRHWNMPRIDPEKRLLELRQYRLLLRDEISEDVDGFFDSNDPRRAQFDHTLVYQDWRNSRRSSAFLLTGYTERSSEVHQHYCWLSPIIVDLVQESHQKSQYHAYYILPAKGTIDVQTVVLTLLSQLLRYQTASLRDEEVFQELQQLYVKVTSATSGADLDISLQDLSLHVINLFRSEDTVFLYLDRADRCDTDTRLALLHILATTALNCRCTLKVFAVISGSDWDFNARDFKEYGDAVITHREVQERINDIDDY
jgi:hypothetical protein